MKVESKFPLFSPTAINTDNTTCAPTRDIALTNLSRDLEETHSPSKSLMPKLVHPDELFKSGTPDTSMQNLLSDALSQSEEYQQSQIEHLYEKQSKLIESMLEQKQKIVDLHKTSNSLTNNWQSIMDIALPLSSGIIALYLGFSPAYSLSKIPAICTSLVSFAIAGLNFAEVPVPGYISTCHMTLCNLYMAYMNPKDTLALVTNFLQIFPLVSQFASDIDKNSICSDEILAQKIIQKINQELKTVAAEISHTMKMIAEKKKFFSIATDYNQLQTQIAAIGAV